jgi:formylglycine-generating enzyme required for sulfatase activity
LFDRLGDAIEQVILTLPDLAVFQDLSDTPELVILSAGRFVMGAPRDEAGSDAEGPQHEVRIAHRLAVGRYPVTFEEYDRSVEATGRERPDDQGGGRGRRPVINVVWNDAWVYVAWLSEQTGKPYRLLSEAEWEYACRAGTTTRYSWGDDPPTSEQANFGGKVGKATEVGTYPPNPWGLYDMHGNVSEWVEDCWHHGYEAAPTDGLAWTTGDDSRRVLRGGSWGIGPEGLRSALRIRYFTVDRGDGVGFRVARTLR